MNRNVISARGCADRIVFSPFPPQDDRESGTRNTRMRSSLSRVSRAPRGKVKNPKRTTAHIQGDTRLRRESDPEVRAVVLTLTFNNVGIAALTIGFDGFSEHVAPVGAPVQVILV